MELQEAVKQFLEPYADLESAEREIAVIGMVLQSFKGVPYAHRKRILEYAQHWVESEQKYKEIRDAESKSLAASKDSGRKQSGSTDRNNRYSHSQISGIRRALKKFRAERKSRRAALKGLKRPLDDRCGTSIEGTPALEGIS